ncbi:hypothetical protein DY468_05210 [Rhodopseudomonas sp. BR0M22]|nr:hypothetical protein [Rhodopseudomonas sp. BR0M22]
MPREIISRQSRASHSSRQLPFGEVAGTRFFFTSDFDAAFRFAGFKGDYIKTILFDAVDKATRLAWISIIHINNRAGCSGGSD